MARSYFIDRDNARREVARRVQYTVNPALTLTEVYEVVDATQRCRFWEAETLYYAGAVLMPTAPNGHRYVAANTGISGTTEPTSWPLTSGGLVLDGPSATGVTWYEVGRDYLNIFDPDQAVYDAWMLKAGKASREIDVTLAGGANAGTFTAKCAQIYAHCVDMAAKSVPYRIT